MQNAEPNKHATEAESAHHDFDHQGHHRDDNTEAEHSRAVFQIVAREMAAHAGEKNKGAAADLLPVPCQIGAEKMFHGFKAGNVRKVPRKMVEHHADNHYALEKVYQLVPAALQFPSIRSCKEIFQFHFFMQATPAVLIALKEKGVTPFL